MKSFRRLLVATTAAVATLAISGLTHAAEFEWKYYTFFGDNTMPAKLQREFAEDIANSSGGRLNITFFTGAEMPYGFTQELQAVATNQIPQMSDLGISVVSGELPGLQVTDMPFLCNTYDKFFGVMKDVEPIINKRVNDKFAVTPLMTWTMPPQQIWMHKELTNGLADLKGKKIRIYSKVHQQILGEFGASGVSLANPEVPSALDRGVIDGIITAAIPANDGNYPEIAKYGYIMNMHMTTSQIIVNDASLNALPADLKQMVLDKSKEWAPKFRERITAAEQDAFKNLEANGEVLIKLSDADNKWMLDVAHKVWDEWGGENEQQAKMLELAKATCAE